MYDRNVIENFERGCLGLPHDICLSCGVKYAENTMPEFCSCGERILEDPGEVLIRCVGLGEEGSELVKAKDLYARYVS